MPNAELVTFNHPRFGVIPCVTATHDIEAGEEIFVHYGYHLNNCPDWYEQVSRDGSVFSVSFWQITLNKCVCVRSYRLIPDS